MTGRRVFLIVQAVLCALIAGLLAAASLSLYVDGAQRQAAGDLFSPMYTREKVGEKLTPILPLFFCSLGMTVSGLLLGVQGENQGRPLRDERLLRSQSDLRARAVHQTAAPRELYLRRAVLAVAAALIIAGIFNGGLTDVLAKGAAICMECVGLG